MIPRTVFIGYDPREHSAYNVAAHSILRRSENVLIHPLSLPLLTAYVNRPIENRNGQLWCKISDAPMSTEFANSRFTVPFIQREGWALFIDCDMVCLSDINKLFDLCDDDYAVMVVKHGEKDWAASKMNGLRQPAYPRKNWSSVMLINCGHPSHARLRAMDRIYHWPGRDLHAFKWLDDDEIGELPPEWNYLVGVDPIEEASKAKLMHFTLGGPWFPNWKERPLDNIWNAERMSCTAR